MPILNDFCTALTEAITNYENEVQSVPTHRQEQIPLLRARINQCLQDKMDAVEFREEMVEYIKNIPAGLLSFIPAFDSRLRKHLLLVLNQERFSEKKLLNKERTEDRAFYRTEIESLRIQITTLNEALDAERAKDNVQQVNQLTRTVALQQQNIDLLTTRNQQLQQSLTTTVESHRTLQMDYETLSKNYNELKAQYDALVAKGENALPVNQNTKPVNHYSPTLFNS